MSCNIDYCMLCESTGICSTCRVLNSNPTAEGTCVRPEYLLFNMSSCNCTVGYFMSYDVSSYEYACATCDLSCESCYGSSETQCISCAGMITRNDTTNKSEVCPNGMYF